MVPSKRTRDPASNTGSNGCATRARTMKDHLMKQMDGKFKECLHKIRTAAGAVSALTVLGGLISAFCFGCYLFAAIRRQDGFAAYWPALTVLSMIAGAFALAYTGRESLRRGGTFCAALRIVCCAGLWIFLLSFVVFSLMLTRTARAPLPEADPERPTVILVFGCHVTNGYPSGELQLRLDRAAALLEHYPDALIAVSGGQGDNEDCSEAEAMQQYLHQKYGIPTERILMEDQSVSTQTNLQYTAEVLRSRGLEDAQVLGVSSWYHLARISFLAQRYGLLLHPAAAPLPPGLTLLSDLTREYMAWIKLLILLPRSG